MSAITSKAIVITAYPGKHGTITMPSRNAEFSLLDSGDFDSDDSSSGGGPKKRRRLTHLSPDEKLLRRKLKNRVAAQTARDRKKALMAELEEKVAQLEEENKALKRQNFSLKEASNTLAKENAALKSRLADAPLTATTKTESVTSSTCCSSAEGTGSDCVSMDGSVFHFCDNAQPDGFLGLLQELADDSKCQQPQAQTATPISQSVCGGTTTDNTIRTNHRSPTPRMVGLSPAELESLNELISIDHVYVKPQPLSLQGGKVGQHKSPVAVPNEENNGSILSPQQKSNLSSPGTKRNHAREVINNPIPTTQPASDSMKSNEVFSNMIQSFPSSTLSSSQSSLPTGLDDSYVTDDLIKSLSDSDMETSLNLLQGFDLEMINSNIETEASKQSSTVDSSLVSVTSERSTTEEALSPSDLNAAKLFDEIYEHYLSIKDSNLENSDSASLSDSGVSSDAEAASPLSSEEFLNDDFVWQDTSFADLFPDLQ